MYQTAHDIVFFFDGNEIVIDTHGGCKQVYDRLAKIARATDCGIEIEQIDHSTVIRN